MDEMDEANMICERMDAAALSKTGTMQDNARPKRTSVDAYARDRATRAVVNAVERRSAPGRSAHCLRKQHVKRNRTWV